MLSIALLVKTMVPIVFTAPRHIMDSGRGVCYSFVILRTMDGT